MDWFILNIELGQIFDHLVYFLKNSKKKAWKNEAEFFWYIIKYFILVFYILNIDEGKLKCLNAKVWWDNYENYI